MVPGTATVPSPIDYPDSDGKPAADNTEQFRWIVVLFGNLSALYREAEVFVAADLLWYPVEGDPATRMAPDVLVAFGRPRGRRGSYMQWLEGGVPMTVVFEIVIPGNSYDDWVDKLDFYETHGVEEYYVFNPDTNRLVVYIRKGGVLLRQRFMTDFVSPRLGVRFDLSGPEMMVYYPDGRRFLTFEEVETARAKQEALQAQQDADKARQDADRARQDAEKATQRSRRMAQLSRAARLGQASPQELAELEALERDSIS